MLFIDLTLNGLITGVFYALMAVGLALIFGVLKVVNFAHGEFYMVGSYAYVLLAVPLGLPVWIALPLAVVVGGIVGWITERTLMRPLYGTIQSWGLMRDEYAIIVTFGLSLLIINLVDKIVGPYPYRGPAAIAAQRIELGPILISGHRLFALVFGIAVLAAAVAFIRYSFWGKQVQAVAQNRLAGALLSPIINTSPDVGIFPAVKSYVIVVLGGMGSIPGAILGALLLGVLESYGAVYISFDYRDTYGLVILILVLLFRPQGLLGEKAREV